MRILISLVSAAPFSPSGSRPPPAWLTPRHWLGPLALQDYGNKPLLLDRKNTLLTCRCEFRLSNSGVRPHRAVLSSICARRGFRIPAPVLACMAIVPAYVPGDDHRRSRSARTYDQAITTAAGMFIPAVSPGSPRSSAPPSNRRRSRRILGLPRFAFTELAAEALAWFGHASRGRRG